MGQNKNEGDFPCENDKYRMDKIEEAIKIIGNRATWLLGFLMLILLGLAGFIFIGTEQEIAGNAKAIEFVVVSLFTFYLGLTIVFIPLLITPRFKGSAYDNARKSITKETFENDIKLNIDTLNKLTNDIKRLIILFITPLPPATVSSLWFWFFG